MEGYHKSTTSTQLWDAAPLLCADLSPASSLVLNGADWNAEKFSHRLDNAAIRNNAARSDVKMAINRSKIHKLPMDFDKLGPSAELNAVRVAQSPHYKMNRFLRTESQSVALAGIRRCISSVASGIRCYYSFCEFRGTPPFPVRERVVAEWTSVFKPGQTFSNYVGYVSQDCYYLELPLI